MTAVSCNRSGDEANSAVGMASWLVAILVQRNYFSRDIHTYTPSI
jgi:hypothetical protein